MFLFFLFSLVIALSVLSLNCNGIRDQSKRAGLIQWLRSLPVTVDVVCLQETHCVSLAECVSWFSSSSFLSCQSPGSNHSCGCVILYRPSLSFTASWADTGGRYLQGEFSFHNKVLRICCLYAPYRNPERGQFLENVSVKIDPSIPTLLVGDFNTVLDRLKDRRGSNPLDDSRESSVRLTALFEDCCVTDIWRYLHPDSSSYTWTKPDGSLASRIDLCRVPYVWVSSVSSCDTVPCPFSDHCALLLSLSVPDVAPPGPGLWKLNTSILLENEYYNLVAAAWRDWCFSIHRFPSLAKWWEEGKSLLKGLTIKYCCERSWVCSANRDLLVRLIEHLKLKVDGGSSSCVGPYHSAMAKLAKLDLETARGAQVRSRARWVEEGETSSAYFFRLKKKAGADRRISAIKLNDGTIVSSPTDLCTAFADFYTSLFSASFTDPVIRDSLLSNVTSSLPPGMAALCEGHLTPDECLAALQGMARRKAPGLDGFPMEFYLKFWPILGPDLVNVLNSCFDAGCLSLSQRCGIISLSFKKGDRLDAKNWRPISLLNVDYKLAARVIAGRLLKVIHLVIEKDQTCGVPGRFIGENVTLLRDIVYYSTSFDIPVAILSLDQEKAFDRVDWDFMRSTLSTMGFGPSFISWVNLFYNRVQSAVNVNGYLSPFFTLSRGVRQGCPLSPLLYVLVSEVLAVNIRCNPRISGLSLPGSPPLLPISQYTDDTSLILSSDESIKATFETYDLYEKASGCKLNRSKSKGLWHGSWRGRTDPPVDLDWSSVKLKVLGVFIGIGDLVEDNWRPRIAAVDKVLSSWCSRSLSYRGKSLVINALALARIWYVASLVFMPPRILHELCSLVFKFFWSGKRDLVSRSVVVQSPLFGGFSVVDVKLKVWSLVAQWVKHFASSRSGWVSFMSFWFDLCLSATPRDVFSAPFSFRLVDLPPFYKSVVVAWRELGGAFSTSRSSLVFGSTDPLFCIPVSSMNTKSCYLYLLSVRIADPHCVEKFTPSFGPLYWPTTWRSLSFFDMDRQVTDLNWKIAHGVLYIAEHLSSFGLPVPLPCFCGAPIESLTHLFFACPLAQSVLSWLQSLMFAFNPMSPVLLTRHSLFGFDPDELRVTPHIFVYILNVCKFFIWLSRNDFRFRGIQPGAVPVIESVKAHVKFNLPLFFRRFKSSRRRCYFHCQWGARGTVASVADGRLTICL